MSSKTDLWIDSRREEMISALQKLITFNSVAAVGTPPESLSARNAARHWSIPSPYATIWALNP